MHYLWKIGDRFKNSIVTDYARKEIINGKIFYLVISGGELYERYHDKLPVFFVEDIFDGYVNLNQERKPERE